MQTLGATAPERILIIKPSSLGDIVHALPVLAGLRRAYPDAHIAWLAASAFAPLLDGNPLLDEVIPFDRRRYGKMWRSPRATVAFWRLVALLRRSRFDLVLDLQGLLRSGLLAFLSGAPQRIGAAGAREGARLLYTRLYRPPDSARHAVDKLLFVLAELGLPIEQTEFPLAVTEHERGEAAALLAEVVGTPIERYSALLPGARWASKRWPAERWGGLVDRMAAGGLPPVVLLGAADEQQRAQRVVAASCAPLINLVGRTNLRQLVALLDGADEVVCCDSGPMHIAAALGRRVTAVFGPTDPSRTGPYGEHVRVVSRELSCAPCLRRRCPLGHHDCLERLEVDAVYGSLRDDAQHVR